MGAQTRQSRSAEPDLCRGYCSEGARAEDTLGKAPAKIAVRTSESSQGATAARYVLRWIAHFSQMWELVLHDIISAHLLMHDTSLRLNTLHIHATCHLVLLVIVVGIVVYFFQGLLLPVLIAAGISVVLEPMIFFLVDPWVRQFQPRPTVCGVLHGEHGSLGLTLGQRDVDPAAPPSIQQVSSLSRRSLAPPVPHANTTQTGEFVSKKSSIASKQSKQSAASVYAEVGPSIFFRQLWCFICVCVVITSVLVVVGSLGLWVVHSVNDVNWDKYTEGERVAMLQKQLKSAGIDSFEEAASKAVGYLLQSMGINVLGSFVAILSEVLLLILFLAFFLYDSAMERSASTDPWKPFLQRIASQVAEVVQVIERETARESVLHVHQVDMLDNIRALLSKLRRQMRIYIKGKFALSVLKMILIGLLYFLLQVDLWIIWTILTFIFNFMPMGSAISTIAPIPFVALDPTKSYIAIGACLVWPIVVHNVVGNIVETRMFASSLNINPVTVLLALTFWTFVWGVLGALVCVPITAMLKVFLQEFRDHPYIAPLVRLMEESKPSDEGGGMDRLRGAWTNVWQGDVASTKLR
eukprot:CAMPEP_0178386404 /NCGR_PEP_ID=MMETSP0689_2-20121128/8543_1 /TAXON_ID=160604 /ORGANISM="Amphidinium massartii, Strain CS-259" /LENGTH=579 /DNA_ID=CAMNT_0020006741 /DNA_START=73 /DNA_END=1808 /DNA_ORIENTATION=+